MVSRRQYTVCFIFLTVTIATLQAQSLSGSLKDDRKKLLIESVKPPLNTLAPDMHRKAETSVSIDKEDILGNVKKYGLGNGGAEFDDKYQISEDLKNFTEKQLFETEPGDEVKTMLIDGKIRTIRVTDVDRRLDKMSLRHKLEGPLLKLEIGGLNLSGWNKKKISEKSKVILKNVYGMEVED